MTDFSALDILRDYIRQGENRVLANLPYERRWGLLEIVRAADHYFIHCLGLNEEDREEEMQSERRHLHRYGQCKAISLFVDQSCIAVGPSLSRSVRATQEWAEAVIQNCGRLGSCEMLIELHKYGLMDLSMPSPGVIHAKTADGQVGVEYVEASEFRIFKDLAAEIDGRLREQNASAESNITDQMSLLVSPWREHFIQYQASPDIDAYFQTQGLLWARGHYEPGQDAFQPHATFGGVPFALYKNAVVEVLGWALKHIGFCKILIAKYPNLDLRNVLTVTMAETCLWDWLSAALDITTDEASQIMGTLKLTPNNKEAHLLAPAVNVPPFLNINSDTVVHSIAGTLSRPFDFMVAELQRQYPRDWDYAVNEREDYFRNELYNLFPTQRFIKPLKPLKLKNEDKITTDIDAVVFDTATGTLGLFQLKWQDPFGTSMRKRNSKMMNFLDEANRWISVVSSSLSDNPKTIEDLVVGHGGNDTVVRKTHLFVLGRHFSHFSGEALQDSRAAWGLWPQLLRSFRESYKSSDPITCLYEMLQSRSPLLRTPSAIESYELQIGKCRIVFDPVAAH